VNVPQWTLARVKTSKLHIDYKPVASLPGVWVIIASLPCLESVHFHPIFRLLSAHLRTILDQSLVIWHPPMARPFSWLGRIYRLSALEQQSSVKEAP